MPVHHQRGRYWEEATKRLVEFRGRFLYQLNHAWNPRLALRGPLLPPDSATMCLFAFFSGPTTR